ncbi:MAG TPA: acyl-CoA dehydrogenase family protein [Acidimicrobiales bacterium]|nr:acyl-CoA dehydrogenase family protein [Acidimicrobiales bacterium]
MNSREDLMAESSQKAEFRSEVRSFLAANAEPKREQSMWSLNSHSDPAHAAREFAATRAWQKLLFDRNLAGLTYPRDFGGRGGESWMEATYREEAANYDVPSGFIASMIGMLGPALMRWGTEAQKKSLVPRLLSGEDTYCQLFSEPGAGSDLAGLATRAIADGDEFVVSGQKVWNSAAQWCTRGMLLARTDPDLPKHKGITFLLVDMATPGIDVRPLLQPTGAIHFNEVFLNDVRVPVENVIGEVNGGWQIARTVLANESAVIGAGSPSSTNRRLVELARVFDRTDDQVIRQELATSYIRERVLGFMGERILAAVRRRENPPMDPSILKLYVSENRTQTGKLAMAIGGVGVSAAEANDEMALWCRSELLNRYTVSIGGGTNEVQRNNLAERALGLPREPQNDHLVPWNEVRRS